MTYRVKVLQRVEYEVDEILHFIANVRKAPQGALRWYQAYEEALGRLTKWADSFPLAPENEFVDYEIRQILFKTRKGHTYRGLFTIVGDEVRLLHVRGSGQDLMTRGELGSPSET